jgi:Holliday junction resolvase RusA-like endonuclease
MTVSDMDRAIELYRVLARGGDDERMVIITIPGPPVSKARARYGRGRTYKTAQDTANEQHTAWHLARAVKEPFAGNVALGCIFFRPNSQRIDVDNMLKHVCDAATGILWADDSQATGVLGIAELDPTNPRTVVVVGHHTSTLRRGTDADYPCKVCGTLITKAGQTTLRSTCSKACTSAARGFVSLDEPVPCAYCGQPFRRTTTAQLMCSPACRADNLRGKRKAAAAPRSKCLDCGVQLAHTRGGRCRPCWKASLK